MVTKGIKGLLFKCHHSDAPEAGWVRLLQMFLDCCEDGFDRFFRGKATSSCRKQDYCSGLDISSQCFKKVFLSNRESVCCHACSNRRNGQSGGRFVLTEVQNLFQRGCDVGGAVRPNHLCDILALKRSSTRQHCCTCLQRSYTSRCEWNHSALPLEYRHWQKESVIPCFLHSSTTDCPAAFKMAPETPVKLNSTLETSWETL